MNRNNESLILENYISNIYIYIYMTKRIRKSRMRKF